MRRVSPKRSSLLREVQPWRDKLREQGFCDWCRSDRDGLEIHEINGGATRSLELDKPYSTNLLCRLCHMDLESMRKEHAICIGLALLRYTRPECFHLEDFYRLTARRWPSEQYIEMWWRRILMGNTRESFQ